jgi:hypothetical protein
MLRGGMRMSVAPPALMDLDATYSYPALTRWANMWRAYSATKAQGGAHPVVLKGEVVCK